MFIAKHNPNKKETDPKKKPTHLSKVPKIQAKLTNSQTEQVEFLGTELREPPTQRSRISPMLFTGDDDDDSKSEFNLFVDPRKTKKKIK